MELPPAPFQAVLTLSPKQGCDPSPRTQFFISAQAKERLVGLRQNKVDLAQPRCGVPGTFARSRPAATADRTAPRRAVLFRQVRGVGRRGRHGEDNEWKRKEGRKAHPHSLA